MGLRNQWTTPVLQMLLWILRIVCIISLGVTNVWASPHVLNTYLSSQHMMKPFIDCQRNVNVLKALLKKTILLWKKNIKMELWHHICKRAQKVWNPRQYVNFYQWKHTLKVLLNDNQFLCPFYLRGVRNPKIVTELQMCQEFLKNSRK